MKPTLGRIIHVAFFKAWRAAIVTNVRAGDFDVFAFPLTPTGEIEHRELLFSGEGQSWRWPPRDET